MATNNQSFTINPDLIWRVVDGNTVVVSPEDGDVQVFSATANVIWQLLVDKKEISEIESYLVSHYIVSDDQAKADVNKFILELIEMGLIR